MLPESFPVFPIATVEGEVFAVCFFAELLHEFRIMVFMVSEAIVRVIVEGDFEIGGVEFAEELFDVRKKIAVPRVAGPAES